MSDFLDYKDWAKYPQNEGKSLDYYIDILTNRIFLLKRCTCNFCKEEIEKTKKHISKLKGMEEN